MLGDFSNDNANYISSAPSAIAKALLLELRELRVEELGRGIVTSHPRQEWHPTVPTRVTREALSDMRSTVLDISYDHGFPEHQPRGGHTMFDRELAIYLNEQMNLVPAEAAVGGIWSFISLVLLPMLQHGAIQTGTSTALSEATP